MRRQLDMARSMGGDVFMSMAVLTVADGEFADDVEGRLGGCQLVYGGIPVCHGRIVLCFP